MKALFITPAYYPNLRGGNERSVKLLAEGLAAKGVDVNVLSFDNEKKDISYEEHNQVKVIRVKKIAVTPNTLAHNLSLIKYKNIVKKQNPDIIHVFNTWHIPAASFFSSRKTKVVATLNNYFPIIATSYTKDSMIEKKRMGFFNSIPSMAGTFKGNAIKRSSLAAFYSTYSSLIRPLSKRLDGYVAYAQGIKDLYVRNGFPANKITVIPSPHDIKLYGQKVKRDKNSVLYVGGIYEAKGFYELLEAARIVDDKKIKFYFVGVKDVPKEIHEFVKNNGINAEFIGKLDHEKLAQYYRKCTLIVHPAQWPEPFARTWIEALSYDIPVISSDNPVAMDILKNSAAFYRRGHPEELAQRIKAVISNKLKLSNKVGRKRLSQSKPVEEMIAFYTRLTKY